MHLLWRKTVQGQAHVTKGSLLDLKWQSNEHGVENEDTKYHETLNHS